MKRVKFFPLILAVSAVITGLTVAFPQYLGPLQWMSIAPAVWVIIVLVKNGAPLARFYLYGLLFFTCYGITVYHWFAYLYPMSFTGIGDAASVAVIILAIFGFSFLQGAISALLFLSVGLIARNGLIKRTPIFTALLLPALFTLFEYIKTIGWIGVPLAKLCLGQSYFMPILATSSLFGSYAVTALIVFVNTLLAIAFTERRRLKFAGFSVGLALCAFSLNLIVGSVIYIGRQNDNGDVIKVALIQGNFPSDSTNQPEPIETLETYENLTRAAASEGAELILWPETAVEFLLVSESALGVRLSELAKEVRADIILGGITAQDDKMYNVTYHVNKNGEFDENYYVKRHLVPFGEYVPMRSFFETFMPFICDINLFSFDFHPGNEAVCYDIEGFGKVGSIICFDSIYEDSSLDSVKVGAELIAISTNDSWFSDSAAMDMHANHSRLIAIETARGVIRAGNTGITAIITPDGEYDEALEIYTRGYLLGDISANSEKTLYSVIGNAFVYFCIAEIICISAYAFYFYRREKDSYESGQ